jgi:hypothetical protein
MSSTVHRRSFYLDPDRGKRKIYTSKNNGTARHVQGHRVQLHAPSWRLEMMIQGWRTTNRRLGNGASGPTRRATPQTNIQTDRDWMVEDPLPFRWGLGPGPRPIVAYNITTVGHQCITYLHTPTSQQRKSKIKSERSNTRYDHWVEFHSNNNNLGIY